jgi:hypothetical protein
MAWSGGVFTRLYDWATDASGGVDIEAARMDGEDNNFKDGITHLLGTITPAPLM